MKTLLKNLSALAVVVLILSGCVTTRQMVSTRKPVEIDRLLILKPLTKVDVVNKGNKAEYSQEVSEEVTSSILEGIDKHIPSRIERQKLDIDSAGLQEIYRELYIMATTVEKSRDIKAVRLSEKMIALLDTYDYNYAMGVLNFGFTRAKGNYGKQMAKGLGIGLLTLGMVVPVPLKSYSTMICYIIDRQNNNIAFYRKDLGQEQEPTNSHVIHEQVGKLLDPYFHASLK